MSEKKALDFEAAMEKLDGIAQQLESGQVPLEKAMDLFEEGLRLSDHCGSLLDKAQLRVEKLVERADGGEESEPLES
jgi:exodeoxyribonuclease VII small subunit